MTRLGGVTLGVLALAALAPAWIDKAAEEKFIGARRSWWAFQKPVRPAPPEVKDSWVRTPIDAFILQALREKTLAPSAPLGGERLARRAALDLTGLPPKPEDVEAFLRDKSPNSYEKLVDRLLASPEYGERWAQRWLDVVRYADTNGYELDSVRTQAWRYRDYVVASFNKDKPYDLFVKEQLAGDELWPGNKEALVATGVHRAGPAHIVGGNQDEEMNRQEVLTEMSNGVGAVFLGITVGCARCHNHKFDPILQADYYRLQAVFAATEGKDVEIASASEKQQYEEAMKAYKTKTKPIQDEIAAIEKPYRENIKAAKKAKLETKLREALDVPKDQRTMEQMKLAKDAMSQVGASWDEVLALIPEPEKSKRAALRKKLHEIELEQPEPPPMAYAVENNSFAPPAYILKGGDPKHKLDPVGPGFPSVLAPENGNVTTDACSRRSALANWIGSREHPLTARVMVNRIWQFRMGQGLVRTPNDFGRLGERPANPKLLDWLATEFMDRGWSVKAIDRMIVLSSVYRQAVADDAAKPAIDPDNKFYWRANRRRLEGEAIRDSVLAVSGKLNPRMGGRPVLVPIEKEVYDIIFTEGEPDNLWPVLPDENEHFRRSLYLLNKRTVRLPMLANFDQPDAMTSCAARQTSTHALQALSMMNSDFMAKQAVYFGKRLESDCGSDRACQVNRAYKLALARAPREDESRMAMEFFKGDGRLEDFCLALVNRNEFVYLP